MERFALRKIVFSVCDDYIDTLLLGLKKMKMISHILLLVLILLIIYKREIYLSHFYFIKI